MKTLLVAIMLIGTPVMAAYGSIAARVPAQVENLGAGIPIERVGCNQYGCWGNHSYDGQYAPYGNPNVRGHYGCVYGRGC